MAEQKVLNPSLYARLKKVFGEVRLVNSGEYGQLVTSPTANKKHSVKVYGGEEYRVCCPVCGDTRFRLYINYMWGTRHPKLGFPMYHLAFCHNEECDLSDLRELIGESSLLRGRIAPREVAIEEEEFELQPVVDPGDCVRITALPPMHPALVYLRDERGFDPEELYNLFYVNWCRSSKWSHVTGRIIFPVRDRRDPGDPKSELITIGWQARCIPVNGKDASPKYWTCPGTFRSRILMNILNAERCPLFVLVEGPLDVARVGLPAVGTFGKIITPAQIRRLRARCANKICVYLPDPDVKDHDAQINMARLKPGFPRTELVRLTAGDPGSVPRAAIWHIICAQLNDPEINAWVRDKLKVPV